MSYIIVARNPKTQRLVIVHEPESDQVAEFDTVDAAEEAADNIPICQAWEFEILEAL